MRDRIWLRIMRSHMHDGTMIERGKCLGVVVVDDVPETGEKYRALLATGDFVDAGSPLDPWPFNPREA